MKWPQIASGDLKARLIQEFGHATSSEALKTMQKKSKFEDVIISIESHNDYTLKYFYTKSVNVSNVLVHKLCSQETRASRATAPK